MPYRDNEIAKSKSRERMQKMRERQRGVTPDSVTPLPDKNVTPYPENYLYRYEDNKKVFFEEVPDGWKVLSDGQLWNPVIDNNVSSEIREDILTKEWQDILKEDVEFIKATLDDYLVRDIVKAIVWFRNIGSGIDPRQRWQNAYRYVVDNFLRDEDK